VREPVWLEKDLVTTVHQLQIRQHGGTSELLDESKLDAALERPRNHFHHSDNVDTAGLAAVYLDAIVSAHAFADGNKRTGLVSAVIFLRSNGYQVTLPEMDAYLVVMEVAAGRADASAVAALLRQNISAAE